MEKLGNFEYTPWSVKTCHFYFLNRSVQHWPILIIFGMQHQEETRCKWLYFWPPHFNTVAILPWEMQVVEPVVSEWCQVSTFVTCIRAAGGHFEHIL